MVSALMQAETCGVTCAFPVELVRDMILGSPGMRDHWDLDMLYVRTATGGRCVRRSTIVDVRVPAEVTTQHGTLQLFLIFNASRGIEKLTSIGAPSSLEPNLRLSTSNTVPSGPSTAHLVLDIDP